MTALMIQGTGSNTGKSLIVAGLCRAAYKRGLRVAPFKPQNMSNNAAVTQEGFEIGRAQALQAQAARLEPNVDMNPILLKPESDLGAQVVVQGRRIATLKARDYAAMKSELMVPVLESFNRLKTTSNLIIVEGAGSPAEVNLRQGDIANMGFAHAANIPVVLVGDIDRGGVIAQLVGTQAVIASEDAERINGFIINKFRGDPALFDDGYRFVQTRTKWQGFGVLPWFADAALLPAEDAYDLERGRGKGDYRIAVLAFSRIANFDDLDPLKLEPGLRLTMVHAGHPIPDCDLVILPGSKSTLADLDFLRSQGWDIDLTTHIRRGGQVLGICGGYQMLGKQISDPFGIEGAKGTKAGLGFLDVETVMSEEKHLSQTEALHVPTGTQMEGYEIHIGRTDGPDCKRPFAQIDGCDEGAISADGRVMGSYLHGMFSSDLFRKAFLKNLGAEASNLEYSSRVDTILDNLAEHIEKHLDVDGLLALANP